MEPIPDKVDGGVIVRDSQGKPIGEAASGQYVRTSYLTNFQECF